MKIEIVSDVVQSRDVTSTKSGSPKNFAVRTQEAFAHFDGTYPEKIQLSLWDRPAYPKGFYELAPSSFRVAKFSKLELRSSLTLVPVK